MIGVGDKVKRTQGNNSGMKPGDIGTVMMIKNINKNKYVKIKEYSSGWHSVDFLERVEKEYKPFNKGIQGSFTDVKINWNEIEKLMLKAVKSEEDRRKEMSEIDKLKQRRDELDKQIKELEENEVHKINLTDFNNSICKMVRDDLISLDAFRKGRTITMVVSNGVTNKTLGKGVSTAMPSDKFDENIGVKLAYYRAMENYWKRKAHEVIRETY